MCGKFLPAGVLVIRFISRECGEARSWGRVKTGKLGPGQMCGVTEGTRPFLHDNAPVSIYPPNRASPQCTNDTILKESHSS